MSTIEELRLKEKEIQDQIRNLEFNAQKTKAKLMAALRKRFKGTGFRIASQFGSCFDVSFEKVHYRVWFDKDNSALEPIISSIKGTMVALMQEKITAYSSAIETLRLL